VDRDQPVSSVEPLETLISAVNAGDRLVAKMMVLFGALALFLGVIGICGVIAPLVSERTREIGIRMALGASPAQVFRMVIGQGLRLALMGVAFGLHRALGANPSLNAVL
jgi:putative ABC transport system permease protein